MSQLTFITTVVSKLLTNGSRTRTINLLKNSSFLLNKTVRNYSVCSKMPTALLLLADGAEDLETVTIADVLRRGKINVTIGGVCGSKPVKCSNGVVICPDADLVEAAKKMYDAVILPGGLGGSKILSETPLVGKILQEHDCKNKIIAAICAAPTALKAHNIGKGKSLTSYPAMADIMKKGDVYTYKDDCLVVVDGNIITSKGPATAMLFSLTIVEQMRGKETACEVAKGLLYQY